jgi:membrane protease subunit HflK
MPWNEPGGKDPWSKRPRDQGPPDLEEVLRKLNARLGGWFGGGGPKGGGGKGAGAAAAMVGVVLLIVWLFSGFYIINAGERGLVLRFGRYVYTTGPGPHWHLPYPIESLETVAVDEVRDAEHQASMLTEDENIVVIDMAVQYRVKDASNYAFEVRVPDATLRQVMESALREVVGRNTMDFVLGAGIEQVGEKVARLMQQTLDQYESGLEVVTANLQQAQAPEPVQPAFHDVVMAREDRVRFINEARSYANGIIPQARGRAARVRQEATAYRDQTIAAAQGDAARFEQLVSEYREAPRVTRDRLYLDAIESVLSNTSKVMMDAEGSNNLLYLPIDKLMRRGASSAGGGSNRAPAFTVGDGTQGQEALRAPRALDGREGR